MNAIIRRDAQALLDVLSGVRVQEARNYKARFKLTPAEARPPGSHPVHLSNALSRGARIRMENTVLKTAFALVTATALVLPGMSYANSLGLGLDVSGRFPHPTIQPVQGGGGGGGGRGSSSGGGGYDAPSGGGGLGGGTGTGPAGPGSGTGRDGAGAGGEIQCRTVVVPGSGRGPQEVCERVVQRCRTVVTPGSGSGPQQICE